jgi:hypothetical protein
MSNNPSPRSGYNNNRNAIKFCAVTPAREAGITIIEGTIIETKFGEVQPTTSLPFVNIDTTTNIGQATMRRRL